MRILYVTRHFNHSGYEILQRLIDEKFDIAGILLKDESKLLNKKYLCWFPKLWYKIKCTYYRCDSLKTLRSEEILAKNNDIPIYKIFSIKSNSFYKQLKKIDPDIIVLGGGWPELLPERVFKYPPLGCINTHPSLLPEFRGTSITRWQILQGVKRSGSTIHYIDDGFDTGKILAQKGITIDSEETPQGLFLKLGKLGATLMTKLLTKIENNEQISALRPEHNPEYYKYFRRWSWDLEKLIIDWEKSLEEIHYFVKANTQESFQYLGPIFQFEGRNYFLRKTKLLPVEEKRKLINGNQYENDNLSVLIENKRVFLYKAGDDNLLELLQVQRYDNVFFLRRAFSPIKVFNNRHNQSVNLKYHA